MIVAEPPSPGAAVVLMVQQAEGDARCDVAIPESARDGAELEVSLGPLNGARLLVLDADGRLIGVAAAFPPRQPSTVTMAVPVTAMRDGRLPLRLRMLRRDGTSRRPERGEVVALRVVGTYGR